MLFLRIDPDLDPATQTDADPADPDLQACTIFLFSEHPLTVEHVERLHDLILDIC